MNSRSQSLPVVVAGGGIGGLAAALALTRQGFAVKVLEQSPKLGEIGAGIQLGPNAFAAFDALGVGPNARARAVYTDEMVMHDALDESLVARVPVGEPFRKRFGNPYAVIHRADNFHRRPGELLLEMLGVAPRGERREFMERFAHQPRLAANRALRIERGKGRQPDAYHQDKKRPSQSDR